MTASDRSLGFNRPWQAKTKTLDPDFSAAYAVGGGFNVALSPVTRLTTSLHFLWRKIDAQGQLNAAGDTSLGAFNIRAINLMIGIQARF
jgi:hypothetical protein